MAKTMVANLAIPSEANFTPAQIDTLRQVAARPGFRKYCSAAELQGGSWDGPARKPGPVVLLYKTKAAPTTRLVRVYVDGKISPSSTEV